jgi:predicted aspartyl protease
MTTDCAMLMRVSTSVNGCFSAESHVVQLFEGHPVRVSIATTQGLSRAGGSSVTILVPEDIATALISRIREIVEIPEKLMGSRSTTVYEATVEVDGQVNAFRCSEIPQSEVLDALNDPRVSEALKLKMRQSIVSGYHNPAYDLNRVVEDFIAENVSNQSG